MDIEELWHPKFQVVSKLIDVLYMLNECASGGLCHIVTDDGNIYDNDLDWVIKWCDAKENENKVDKELSKTICIILKQMTFQQRAILFDMKSCGFRYFSKEDIEDYINTFIDDINSVIKEYDYREEFL